MKAILQKNAQRRSAKRGAVVVAYDRAEIFERDRWRCQLCGKRVDRRLTYPALLSASIDHILPLAAGGDDAPWNVQLAHLRCNSTKGARPADDQLRLAV